MPSPSGFAQAGLTTVLLPSGYRVRGAIPGLRALAERGLVDVEVALAALRLGDPKRATDPEPSDIDETKNDLRVMVDALVAGFPREAQDPGADPETGEWKWIALTVSDLPDMDQRDRVSLEDLVLRQRTADEISTAAMRGEITEGPGETERLAAFRDDGDGPADRGDGASVGDAAVGVTA